MINELMLLIKKHIDTLNEQMRTRPQETLEFKMNKQMQTFTFSTLINLFEEEEWAISVNFFETTNSAFNITAKNNSFSISIPGHWRIPNNLEDGIIEKLKNLLKQRSQNDIEFHEEQVRRRINQ